jgi:ribosomal protein S18 acetylase RimI-like enzyme
MGSAMPPGLPSALIRPATIEDARGVGRLLETLGYPCDDTDAGKRIQALADDDNQRLLVADVHGGLFGLVAYDLMYYLPLGVLTCRITALAIAEAAQRQGLGRALLREAESRARGAGAARIELTTAKQRLQAHDFYRACGYEEISLRFMKRLGDA